MIVISIILILAIIIILAAFILTKVNEFRTLILFKYHLLFISILILLSLSMIPYFMRSETIPLSLVILSTIISKESKTIYHSIEKTYDATYLYRIIRALQRCKSSNEALKITKSMPLIKINNYEISSLSKSIDLILETPGDGKAKVEAIKELCKKVKFSDEDIGVYIWSHILLSKALEGIDKALIILYALSEDVAYVNVAEELILMLCDERWIKDLDSPTRAIVYLNTLKLLRKYDNIPPLMLKLIIPKFIEKTPIDLLSDALRRRVIEETLSLYSHICSIKPSQYVKHGIVNLLKKLKCKLTLNKVVGEATLECSNIEVKICKEEWFSLVNCIQ